MKVNTVRVIDPRIEPRPNPTYAVTVGAKQNQYYTIPASGLSDSYITFNNLTTLGADRAYLDTFELLIRATVTMNINNQTTAAYVGPSRKDFVVESFPFNKVCEQVKVNINGGAFFSQPLDYIHAKERYWDDRKLNEAYGNVCPCNKPWTQTEDGSTCQGHSAEIMAHTPTRMGPNHYGYASFATGCNGTGNNDIVKHFEPVSLAAGGAGEVSFVMEWREPIFASPFSNRMDETYGRPLYNITSMDIAFNLQNLTNMLRVNTQARVASYSIHLNSVQLCYQVLTIPPGMSPPAYTVVPYRRFVPYVTDFPSNPISIKTDSREDNVVTMTSGVYTLNEVPTAIWVFAAPTRACYQQNPPDGWGEDWGPNPDWSYNKLFAQLRHISISCANTTQILNTASIYDLYRIAKANGCMDSFTAWARNEYPIYTSDATSSVASVRQSMQAGPGSVLRLIPGTDIVLPDQNLIPGANANNMVFQVSAEFNISDNVPPNYRNFALWLLFEYVGVATLTPGQCQIEMNPLGNGVAMNGAPVISASTSGDSVIPSTMEGSGWLDKLKSVFGKLNQFAKNTGIVGKMLNYIPTVGPGLSAAAKSLGYGQKGFKRMREDDDDFAGGAVMGLGDFC